MRLKKKKISNFLSATELLDLIQESLENSKAIDNIIIDLKNKSDITDAMIITEGRSDRHVRSIADNVIEILKQCGQPYSVEGIQTGEWVLVDAYSVIIHIFQKDARIRYKLENLWQI